MFIYSASERASERTDAFKRLLTRLAGESASLELSWVAPKSRYGNTHNFRFSPAEKARNVMANGNPGSDRIGPRGH